MDFHTICAHVYLQVLTDKKKFLCTKAIVDGVINARRMRTRVTVLCLFVCLSVTSLLVSFHVYMTNYTYLPVLR